MPIQDGDIKIVASQVLADVPEGGGAATGVVIDDGVSNNLFPDVGELDHVYGRAQLRKVFVAVQTPSRDVYLGSHAIVADEPDDPGVSCLLFATQDAFDTRAAAKNRIESYLIQGTLYGGQLFGDHIAGQMAVSIVQRVGSQVPAVGDTLLLRKNEGLGTQTEQFVRVIDLSSVERPFTDSSGDFTRLIVTLSISDQLRDDYRGFPASRFDAALDYTNKCKVYDTNVADAARYFGVKPLTAAAAAGDRTVSAVGIFVPLVPSSRTETGIADARMTQQSFALVPGSAVASTFARTAVWTSASPLFVGGGILPGSLSLAVGSTALTDEGGRLLNGTVSVGTVDYANGIAYLSTNVFGTGSNTISVTLTPSAPVQIASESIGLPVTDASRRLTWVVPLSPAPAAGSLQVSYRYQGRWYVLTDDGSGAVRGADAAVGAGFVNYSTGTVNLTLGALPDVPSSVILTWATKSDSALARPLAAGAVPSPFGGFVPFQPPAVPPDVRARASFSLGSAVLPGSLTVTWPGGNTASDGAGTGELAGAAKGAVQYEQGTVYFAPDTLPAVGTNITFEFTATSSPTVNLSAFTDTGSTYTGTLGGPIKPRSLAFGLRAQMPVRGYPGVDNIVPSQFYARDDGAGNIVGLDVILGTINYTTGAFVLQKTASVPVRAEVFTTIFIDGTGSGPSRVAVTGIENRTVTLTLLNLPTSAKYASASVSATSVTLPMNQLAVEVGRYYDSTLNGAVAFSLGGARIASSQGTVYEYGPAAPVARGTMTLSGPRLDSWTTGLTNAVTNWSAAQTKTVGPLCDVLTFRTASAPIAPSGFSISGELENGTPFSASADSAGVISAAQVRGDIDYETGIVSLTFGTTTVAAVAKAESLRYNAVAYNYLPLDAAILGLDPVRLPSDGRVPIFRRGSVVVIHHTATTAPAAVTAGQTVNLGRANVGQVRVIGNDGAVIITGYSLNRPAGTVTFASVAGYSQPVRIEHRIEEAALLADVQISGLLRLNRPLSRAYPAGSKVSSALLMGDLFARVSALFDQGTWSLSSPVWSDDVIGGNAGPTYDTINYPAVVENFGAVTERWALVFNGSTTFAVIGEHLGQIGTGNTASDCIPTNPATGTPYFTLDRRGFNAGWSAGNAIRLNTVGALAPVWVARVVQQGSPVVASDSFTLAVRGDVDTP